MRRNKLIILTVVGVILFIALLSSVLYKDETLFTYKKHIERIEGSSDELDINGQWQAILPNKDDLIISINKENQEIKITSSSRGYYNYIINDWQYQYNDKELTILLDHKLYYEVLKLSFKDNNLVGKYIWNDEEKDIVFDKMSKKPSVREFGSDEFNFTLLEYCNFIKNNSNYKEDNMEYEFKYELGNKEKYENIIKELNLDEITKGKDDIDLMLAIMNVVCDKFPHSSYNTIEASNLEEVMNYSDENGGLNCKELSYMLSELLRAYDIEAKYIRCFPNKDYFNDCHVVVHAYSSKYNQWVLLDPTYRLILKDKNGNYMNIETFREWISKYGAMVESMDEENENYLICNENAGYTGIPGEKFDLISYTNYMAKNLAVIECSEENIVGSRAGEAGNDTIYLVPDGYTKVGKFSIIDEKYVNIITTDSNKFYSLP